ncbi:uncharacterized protein LOC134840386 [Symsagittifera roscoffensis]|uniref:uncharacterized protein LOC134840386 n=1 Tax=Symsagittifera roscoffensis TaxID=84072 RepID=UPI00307B6A14
MSVRGYSPSTPNGAGIPYGQPQMGYPNAGGGGGGPPQMMDPNLQQQQMGGGYAMPPGAYNRGTRMEHVSNKTLSNRSFGAVLPATARNEELNSGVVRQIQMDWDNRQYLEAITLGIKKIADFLNKFNVSCHTRLAFLNERLSHLERQLDYIQAKVPRSSVGQSGQSHT